MSDLSKAAGLSLPLLPPYSTGLGSDSKGGASRGGGSGGRGSSSSSPHDEGVPKKQMPGDQLNTWF